MIYTVKGEDSNKRLDVLMTEISELSRSAAVKAIEKGNLKVNGNDVPKKYLVKENDLIEFVEEEPQEYEVEPENIPLDIIYEDNDIVVINKPSGMVVHPAPGNYSGTLVNALLYHCKDSLSGVGGVLRPGIVHRIDKDTSGLLVVAKNDQAHKGLSEQLEYHGVTREYHALAKGGFKVDTGTVSAPIGRHPVDRKKMAVLLGDGAHAKEAVTHYEVMERFRDVTYIKCNLETGRTHQIRVHMAYIGHALLGDEVYGGNKIRFEKVHPSLFDGQMLHAKKLSFIHPITKEQMTFEAPLPENFTKALDILRRENL